MILKKCIFILSLITILAGNAFSEEQKKILAGWGPDTKNPEKFFAEAENVGFDVLIISAFNKKVFGKIPALSKKYNIKVYLCIAPMGGMKKLWKADYPDLEIPWQQMNDAELAAEKFISAGKNKCLLSYQWGGEPLFKNEVLLNKIICLSSTKGKEVLEKFVKKSAAVPGITGIALDGFGYQNYNCCYCKRCLELLDKYRKENPQENKEKSRINFYRKMLVEYINLLSRCVHAAGKGLKTTIHLWPVFAPEPLYGNRLDVDYCGQTAAWYTLWPEEKIVKYSKIIKEEEKKYFPRPEGVGMIGYYDRPGVFPVKDAARVEMELKAMLENGCSRIQVCGARDVVRNKEIAAVFRKYFK